MAVSEARGRESEINLAFAALTDFSGPFGDRIGALPEPQAAALRAGLPFAQPAPGTGLKAGHWGARAAPEL